MTEKMVGFMQKFLLLTAICVTTQILCTPSYHANPLLYTSLESEYPSYISINSFGLCLRARKELTAGTIVGTARMIATTHPYIHDHQDMRHRHVSIIGFRAQKPIYGQVVGKYAFCNHACNPNCALTRNFYIMTRKRIFKGQELTVPYDAYLPYISWQHTWSFSCLCGDTGCKKTIDSFRTDLIHPAAYNIRSSLKTDY